VPMNWRERILKALGNVRLSEIEPVGCVVVKIGEKK